jgi:hypothetical protein
MAIVYSKLEQGITVYMCDSVPVHSATIGDQAIDNSTGINYYYDGSNWVALGIQLNGLGSNGILHTGSTWTDNLDGTLTIPTVDVTLYNDQNWTGVANNYTVAGGTTGTELTALTDESTNYIYLDYNLGSPQWVITTSEPDYNRSDRAKYITLYRAGNFLHILDWGFEGSGLSNKLLHRIYETNKFERASGLGITTGGNDPLQVNIAAGDIWNGANREITPAINSWDDVLFSNYHTAGVWDRTVTGAGSGIANNTNYDNGTNLVALGSGKYVTNWYYKGIESGSHLYEVIGRQEHNSLAAAELEASPSIPELVESHTILVGRVICQQGNSSPVSVDSAFDLVFKSTNVTAHNDLSGIQGGTGGEYFHLTNAQHTYLTTNTFTEGSGTNNYVARWTPDGSTLGDSLIRDNGTTLGINVSPDANNTLRISSPLQFTQYNINSYSGGSNASALQLSTQGINSGTNNGIVAVATGSTLENVGGVFIANGTNPYSVRLSDGTQGIGKFLKSVTSDGKANWADITEADVTDLGTYAKVGTYSDTRVPRWNSTTNTLESGSIRDNGLGNIGLDGTAPSPGTVLFASTSKQVGLHISSSSTTSIVTGAAFQLYGLSTASTTTINGVVTNIGNGYGVADSNIGYLSSLTGTFTGVTNKQYGVYSIVSIDSSSDNVGGYFEASNGGSGNAYSLKLVDGLQAAGKVLTSDSNGNASWQTPAVSGMSNLIDDTTPQLGGTLDANLFNIDMGVNTITDPKVGQWDIAYGWGDHSTAGYALVGSYTANVIPKWDSTTNTLVNGIMQDDGDRVLISKNIGVHTGGSKQTFQVSGFVSDNDLATRLYSPIKSQLSLTAQPTVKGAFSSIHAVTGSFLNVTSDSLNGYSLDFATQYDHGLANGFHIRMLRVSSGDTVGTVSGIRIEPFSIQGTATNVYGVYQVGSELNRFGGNVRSDGQFYSPQHSTGVTTNLATFNCDNGNSMVLDLTNATANIILTFTNMQSGGTYFLKVIQKSANFVDIGTYIVSGGSVKWPGGTAPTITTSPFAIDTIVFYYDGINLFGNYAQDYQ